jgi:hypothetical protein
MMKTLGKNTRNFQRNVLISGVLCLAKSICKTAEIYEGNFPL